MSIDLMTCDARSGRPGSVWDYISPSRLSLWARCPLAWRYRYLDGFSTASSPSLFVGKACHAALEWYYRHRQLGISASNEAVFSHLNTFWEEQLAAGDVPFANQDAADRALRQTEGLVKAYLDKRSADEPRPLAVEAAICRPLVDPATGEDLGIPMLGIIDLVLDVEEGPVIIDFKTASKNGPSSEVVHEIQLSSYAYLFRQATGKRESELQIRSLIKTKTPQIVVHCHPARTDVHFARLFALVREYLDALDAGRFSYRPTWTCASCDFRTHCARWTP